MDRSLSLSVIMPVYNEVYTIEKCIERVLAVRSSHISEIELIVVDDGSTDGTKEILHKYKERYPHQIVFVEHGKNKGKGSAVRTALESAKNDVCIIQDADLEYNPEDFDKLVVPFIKENADAVFGSRFIIRDYARVLYYRHALMNRFLTFLTNLITDLNYTDMETCYKAVRTGLLKSIPLRSNGFDLEPEISIKLAKRGAHIFEVPISYSGRTRQEGKKIGWKDGVMAFITLLKYLLIDDIYKDDEYGSHILTSLTHAPKFSQWMADTIKPFVGKRVLEIGAGIGNMTGYFIPKKKYVVSDLNENYLKYMRNNCKNKPYLEVKKVDLTLQQDFDWCKEQFDTVICLNVLEHISDDVAALKNICTALNGDGRAIILVPQNQSLYSSLDAVVGHVKRYSTEQLRQSMIASGFEVEQMITDFNKIGVLSWVLNGKLMRRKHFSRVQLKILNSLTWLFRIINPLLPWNGLSLICVGKKAGSTET
ncbi:glycosyltransferase [Candidatus Saganbacteria bacterium]|nr:glycosyltransferase [Candidatus Saganbacteria bacterium]